MLLVLCLDFQRKNLDGAESFGPSDLARMSDDFKIGGINILLTFNSKIKNREYST
jgi:hypothetical protein